LGLGLNAGRVSELLLARSKMPTASNDTRAAV